MFTFIDTKTGNAFNGSQPYVFWFENGQSTNLNYVLQICCYSDKSKLTIECDSDVFSILKMDQLIAAHERIVMNKKLYIDLETLKTKSFTVRGYRHHNGYVYLFYILANSCDAGEFIDSFYINGVEYKVGADFYPINEILQSNLENLELKMPESIQRAIYEENLHEESNDNITLNRKYKELLMNYWDIVANKGSYQSLINSLKWFEWGDLVRIEEVWKNAEAHKDVFKLEELNTQLDTYMKSQLQNLSKTTYIGLYYALYQLENDYQNRVVYQDTWNKNPQLEANRIYSNERFQMMEGDYDIIGLDEANMIQTISVPVENTDSATANRIYNEEVPQLQHVVALWNNLDLCLKMTLLGNFYQTYFAPIHLDVVHSTIEAWVFSYAAKILHNSEVSRLDCFNGTSTFDLEVEYLDDSINSKVLPRRTFVYNDTLFKSPIGTNICGVSVDKRVTIPRTAKLFLQNLFNAECGLVHFYGSVASQNTIYRERLTWSRNGTIEGQIDDTTTLIPEDDVVDLDFHLRFREGGEYKLYFELYGVDSRIYTKTVTVSVEDDARSRLKLYKVKRIDPTTLMESEDLYNILNVNGLAFQISNRYRKTTNFRTCNIFSQFFCYDRENYMEHIGLNHTISIPLRGKPSEEVNSDIIEYDYIIYKGVHYDLTPEGAQALLESEPDDYWCYIVNRIVDAFGEPEPTLICIRKDFNMDRSVAMEVVSTSGQLTHIVDEYRFYPIFHELVELDNSEPITYKDIVFVEPDIKHSKIIDRCNWEFKNMTTLKSTYSELLETNWYPDGRYMGDHGKWLHGGTQGILFAATTPKLLDPGYYNIILHYMEGDKEQEISINSAFLLEKK